jgi:hypothetical protein
MMERKMCDVYGRKRPENNFSYVDSRETIDLETPRHHNGLSTSLNEPTGLIAGLQGINSSTEPYH